MPRTYLFVRKSIGLFLIYDILVPLWLFAAPLCNVNSFNKDPQPAIVAGNEFYAEQISASVYGNSSYLTHTLITNDTNIFHNLDFSDPAFLNASLLISASNGLSSSVDPSVFSSGTSSLTSAFTANAFFGFLYYTNQTKATEIPELSQRALRIISEVFQIDLIRYNSTSDYFFPFIGYYPRWNTFQEVIFSNVPKDGYFGAVDYARISSTEYLTSKPFTGSLVMLDDQNVLDEIVQVAGEYYDTNLQEFVNFGSYDVSQYNISFLEQNLQGIPFFNATGLGDISGIFNAFSAILGGGGFLDTVQDSRLISLVVQYEGHADGIIYNKDGTYRFDLFKALGFAGSELKPSKSIYVALIGALYSSISINLFSSEVIDFTPKNQDFSTYLIERVELAAFLTGQDVDLTILTDYSIKTFWKTSGGESTLYSTIYNPSDDQNVMNSLYQLGIDGIPGLPLGLSDPIQSAWVLYSIPNTELILDIKKSIDSGFNNITGLSNETILVSNVGNRSAWGLLPDRPFFTAEQVLSVLQTFEQGQGVYDYLETFARSEFDQTLEEFLGMKDARNFFLDTNEDGLYDSFYPNPYDTASLTPFNPDFAAWLLTSYAEKNSVFGSLTPTMRSELSLYFNNSQSIFNPENYILDPGEGFSIEVANQTASIINTYTTYEEYNYTSGTFPFFAYGQSSDGTTYDDGLAYNDARFWNISSQQVGEQYLVQVIFEFQNTTTPNPEKELDQLRLVWRGMNNISLGDSIQWAIFNHTAGDGGAFQDFSWNTNSINSNGEFLYNFNSHLSEITNADANYTTFVRLTIVNDAPFDLSLDDFNLNFSMLDTNALDLGSARITYSSETGHNRYSIDSNNAVLMTRDAPSLVGLASVAHNVSYAGELNTYTLCLCNNGTRDARQVNITLAIPGIIADPGNFTLIGNTLNCSLGDLPSQMVLENISFKFYTPNSLLIPQATIDYENYIDNQVNGTDFSTNTNQIFLTAPIDYNTRIPSLHNINFTISTNTTSTNPTFLAIGQLVNMTVTVENLGNHVIHDAGFVWDENLEGFETVYHDSLKIENLNPGAINAQNISIILKKTTYRGYLLPPLTAINGTESQTFRQNTPSPIVLGTALLLITREVSNLQPYPGDSVQITVTVKNTGNIEMENILVNDINCFPQSGYTLLSGVLSFSIAKLDPGESTSFSYMIKAKGQGNFDLRPPQVNYFFVYKEAFSGSVVSTKIQQPGYILLLYILVPVLISVIAIGAYYFLEKKQKREDFELRRREELMFGKEGTNVAWHRKVLSLVLDEIQEGGG